MRKFVFFLFLLFLPFTAAQSTWPTPAGNCGGACNAAYVNIHDDWNANQGTQSDQISWVNVNMGANVLGQPQLLDAVCYIYDGYGTADSCYFRNAAVMATCLTASQTFLYPFCNNNPLACSSNGAASQFSFPAQYLAQAIGPQRIVAQFYMGCTSSSYTWHRIEDFYHVVDKQQYDCNGLSLSDPDYEGDNNNGWVEISANAISCAGSEICDQLAVQPSTAALSTPPNPCRRIQGAACQTTPQCVTGLNCNQGNCCPQTQVWNGVQCGPPCIDVDGDGYGNPGNLACPNGVAADCNDNNSSIHPGAIEVCDDASSGVPVDNDCNNAANCLDSYCNGQNALYYAHPACNGPASSCSGQYCGYYAQNAYLALITCNNGVCSMCGDGTCQTSAQCSESCPGLLPGIQYGGVIPYEHPTNCEQDCCGFAGNACVGTGNPNYGGGNVCSSLCEGSNGCSSVQFINACNGLPPSARVCKNETHYQQCCQGSAQYCGASSFCISGSCNSCSTTCDGTCQSSACFNSDPDCSSTGSVQPCPGVCTIPNGQNEQCECDSDTNCPSTHFCNQQAGWDPCIPRVPEFPCMSIGTFSCFNSDVHECQPQYGGTSSGYVIADACSPIEQCDNSTVQQTHQCSPASTTYMQIDDAPLGIPAFKQEGDVVVLRFIGSGSMAASFDTNAFTVISGNCALSSTGQNTCKLRVTAQSGKHTITLGNQVETIEVITDPIALYITSRSKLFDRYPVESMTVKAVLEKAYDKASKQRGIVYDLDEYMTVQHPFNALSFTSYHENPAYPIYDTYDYNIEAASFIHQKCDNCKTTLIGDDYVLPQFRHETVERTGNWWLSSDPFSPNTIFTDQPFNKQKISPISNFGEYLKKPSADIVILYPFSHSEYSVAAQNLSGTIWNTMDAAYSSHIGIFVLDANAYSCESYATLRSSNQILIGNEQDNSLISCYNSYSYEANVSLFYVDKSLWNQKGWAAIIYAGAPAAVQTMSDLVAGNYLSHFGAEILGTWHAGLELCNTFVDLCSVNNACNAENNVGECITNGIAVIIPGDKIGGILFKKVSASLDNVWMNSLRNAVKKYAKLGHAKYLEPLTKYLERCEGTNCNAIAKKVTKILENMGQSNENIAKIGKEKVTNNIVKFVDKYGDNAPEVQTVLDQAHIPGAADKINTVGNTITEIDPNGFGQTNYVLKSGHTGHIRQFNAQKRIMEDLGETGLYIEMPVPGVPASIDFVTLKNGEIIISEIKSPDITSEIITWNDHFDNALNQINRYNSKEEIMRKILKKPANTPVQKRIVFYIEPPHTQKFDTFWERVASLSSDIELIFTIPHGG